MTEILEAEIAAAIRKFIDERGVLYYQHANELAAAIMLPVGHAVSQIRPVVAEVEEKVEKAAHKIEATIEEVAEEVKVKADAAVTAVEAVVTPKAKRAPRKKGADEGSGD